LGIPKMLV